MNTMQDYILEQPEVLQNLVNSDSIAQLKARLLNHPVIRSASINRLVMIASGTSYNAAVAASHYIDLPVETFYPYEFTMYCDVTQYDKNTLFIFISQSGESIETYNALAKAKVTHRTLAVTAVENCTISRLAHTSILFGCGRETVIYRTKGFTSSLITLVILGKIVSHDQKLSLLAQAIPTKQNLRNFIHQSIAWLDSHAEALAKSTAMFFVSCGKNTIITCEAALKAVETIRVPAISYELEEFVHGPQNAVTDNTQIVIVENSDDVNNKAWKLFVALKKLNKSAYFIAAKEHPDYSPYLLTRPDCYMDEIFTICALQQLCYTTSQLLGVDLTQRGLAELGDYIKKSF